jgi:hypothetical protein
MVLRFKGVMLTKIGFIPILGFHGKPELISFVVNTFRILIIFTNNLAKKR